MQLKAIKLDDSYLLQGRPFNRLLVKTTLLGGNGEHIGFIQVAIFGFSFVLSEKSQIMWPAIRNRKAVKDLLDLRGLTKPEMSRNEQAQRSGPKPIHWEGADPGSTQHCA